MGPPTGFNAPMPYSSSPPTENRPPVNAMGPPPPGAMGPPKRPEKDKPTDVNELSDIFVMAGVDLNAEDELLRTDRGHRPGDSFNTSFHSNSSSTLSPNNSFNNAYSQGSLNGLLPGAGPLSQPTSTERSVEDEVVQRHERAAREHSERSAKHLNNPFLDADPVRYKLDKIGREARVQIDRTGFYEDPQQDRRGNMAPSGHYMHGPDGSTLAAVQKPHPALAQDAKLAGLLTLISLAAQERLRSLMEDAYTVSRGRQISSNGIVPPEWQSLAAGAGQPEATTAVPLAVTKSSWEPENAISPMTQNALKGMRVLVLFQPAIC